MIYRRVIALFLVLCPLLAFADSIPTYQITQISMQMFPNTVGDNVTFQFSGPNVSFSGYGGMACFDFCSSPVANASGITSQVFISNFLTLTIEGKAYDGTTLAFDALFDTTGNVFASALGSVASDTNELVQFKLILPTNGKWTLNFIPDPDNPGMWRFTTGTFSASAAAVPEPSTLALLVTGILGIAGTVRRKTNRT